MKFVGGSRHGQDAPDWVRALAVAGQREFNIEEHRASGWNQAFDEATPSLETYVVRTWTTADGRRFRFLAITGKDRNHIESMAAPMFRAPV
jgi:hypothetical protein